MNKKLIKYGFSLIDCISRSPSQQKQQQQEQKREEKIDVEIRENIYRICIT